MKRREFLIKSTGLLGLPLLIQEIACDSGMDPYGSSDTDSDGSTFTVRSSVDSGHSHTVKIQYANVNEPPMADVTITTSNDGGHTHQITLTTADYQALQEGETVVKTATTVGGHNHTFSIKVPG
jgi:hypothetical protein